VIVVDAPELARGSRRIAERVAIELGDVEAGFGVALPLVAADDQRVLAFGQHAFERRDGGSRVAEPLLDTRGAGECVVPERAVRVGVALRRREVVAERDRGIAPCFASLGALVRSGFVELGRGELGAQRFAA